MLRVEDTCRVRVQRLNVDRLVIITEISISTFNLHLFSFQPFIMSGEEALRDSLSSIITGTESSVTGGGSSGTNSDDDLTPFPSPNLSAKSLAGLSRESFLPTVRSRMDLST